MTRNPAPPIDVRRLRAGEVALARAMNALFAEVFEAPDDYSARPPDEEKPDRRPCLRACLLRVVELRPNRCDLRGSFGLRSLDGVCGFGLRERGVGFDFFHALHEKVMHDDGDEVAGESVKALLDALEGAH